jgi:hypothetical protein
MKEAKKVTGHDQPRSAWVLILNTGRNTDALKHLEIAVQAVAEQGSNQSAVYESVLHEKLSAVRPLPAICRQLWKKMNWKYATVLLTI